MRQTQESKGRDAPPPTFLTRGIGASNGGPYAQRRWRVDGFDPAMWEPLSATVYFRSVPQTVLDEAKTSVKVAAQLAVGGTMLHCETQFERRRRVAPRVHQAKLTHLGACAGGGASDDASERSMEGYYTDSSETADGYDTHAWAMPFMGAGAYSAAAAAAASYSRRGGGGESVGGVPPDPVVVTALRGAGVQIVIKPEERPADAWTCICLPLSPEELERVYDVQTQAVGAEYDTNVAWNLLASYFMCPRAATSSGGRRYSCAELVATSLRGTSFEMVGTDPCLVNPEMLHRHLLVEVSRRTPRVEPPPACSMVAWDI